MERRLRTLSLCLLILTLGCTRTETGPAPRESIVPVPAGVLRIEPDPPTVMIRGDGLYRDEQIRGLTKDDIAAHKQSGMDVIGLPILSVVTAGETKPRSQVFRELGLDESRVRDFRQVGVNMTAFLTWQVSPSYDISCMTATNDGVVTEAALKDPARKVYGVRLLKRP